MKSLLYVPDNCEECMHAHYFPIKDILVCCFTELTKDRSSGSSMLDISAYKVKSDSRPEWCPIEKINKNYDLLDALDSVTWYNGLSEIIVHWKDDDYFEHMNHVFGWDWDKFNNYDLETREQLEIIWMICVCLFGDYGTSPRSGWIYTKNKVAFHEFIDSITKTYRESYQHYKEED